MAVVVGDAAVRLRPEASGFANEAESEIDGKLPGVAKKAAGFFAAAFAAVKIGGFLIDAVGQASDLSESASKVGVVFGDAAGSVRDFASDAATALGVSQAEALGAAGTFGNLLRSVGLAEDASADMSTSMISLAGDLASFNNTDPAVALDALRSGLLGETEPLKAFGVNMNEATLQAKALALGLSDGKEPLDSNAKAQAAYALIMEQTSLAQGDFARTSGGLANQQRILAAQFLDVKANVGGLLAPLSAVFLQMITGTVIPAVLRLTENLPALGDAVGRVGEVFGIGFVDGAQSVNEATEGVTGLGFQLLQVAGYFGGLASVAESARFYMVEAFSGSVNGAALAEGGIIGLGIRVGQTANEIQGVFYTAWQSLSESLAPALATVQGAIGAAVGPIREAFSGIFSGGGGGGAGDGFGAIVGVISSVLETVGPLIGAYIGRWAEVFAAALPAIVSLVQAVVPVIGDLFTQLGPILSALLPIVSQVAGVFASTLVAVITALTPVIPPLVAAIGQVVGVLAGAFLGVLTALAPVLPVLVTAIASVAAALAGAFAQALQAVLPILPVIAAVLGEVAVMLAGALGSALQTIIPVIAALIPPLLQVATVIVSALMAALQALLPVLPVLVGALLQLVITGLVPLLPILPLIANLFATIIAALVPILPVIIQVVVLLVQLAIDALLPLVPVIGIVAGLITMLIGVIVPIIQVLVTVAGAFIGFAGQVIGIVAGLVGTVAGVFSGLLSTVTGIFGGIFSVISGIFNSISGFVSGAVSGIAGSISGAFSGVSGAISSVFGGIGGAVSDAFSGVTGIIKGAVNGAISVINSGIGQINSKLIANANKVPFVSIPNIPTIPRLHSGGEFLSGVGAGEGLALLRDRELVVTPEQRVIADNLLRDLFSGRTPDGTTTTTAAERGAVQVINNITQQPGESGTVLAARTSATTVWNLNNGLRTVGAGAAP